MLGSSERLSFFLPAGRQSQLPLLIFLPGLDGTGQLLMKQIPELATIFDVRCLVIPSTDQSSWKSLVAETVSLIRKEINRAERSIYLLGESFGGCLALKLTARHPELISGLVLSNPASSFGRHWLLRVGSFGISWLPEWFYNSSSVGLLPWLVAWSRVAPEIRGALLAAMQSVPAQTAAWRLSLLRDFELPDSLLTQILCPTLVIAGAIDRLLPSVEEAERLSQSIPQAQSLILPLSGHACLLEDDVHLLQILRERNFYSSSSLSAV
ncbi:MAG: alpha/beta hydrolase [Cyanobacteria bacterium P01_H01_bin.15]